jgi:putative transposase
MARLPRFILPGYPQHVIQRGNNRAAHPARRRRLLVSLGQLRDAAQKFQCDVHAYVLMPNHFHLMLTPWQNEGIGKLMQYTGRYYVQHVNTRYGRTGTLWDGRYRATLFDPPPICCRPAAMSNSTPCAPELVTSAATTTGPAMPPTRSAPRTSWCTPHASTSSWAHAEGPARGLPRGLRRAAGRVAGAAHTRRDQQGLGARR